MRVRAKDRPTYRYPLWTCQRSREQTSGARSQTHSLGDNDLDIYIYNPLFSTEKSKPKNEIKYENVSKLAAESLGWHKYLIDDPLLPPDNGHNSFETSSILTFQMASAQAESNFAYHGLQTHGLAHADAVKYLIKEFLESINFDRSLPLTKDHELESAVLTYFKSLNMGQKTETAVQKVLKLSVTLAHRAYTLLPFENKVLCAVQFLYMFLVDDIAEEFMEDLRYFGQNFTLNNGHRHPLLHNFDKHLRYLARYYGPYCHSVIIKSLFDYVNGRIVEHQMEQSNFRPLSDSRLMPMFLRTKVGAAEILIAMLWPRASFPEEKYLIQYFPAIQELVLFIDFTNDILSYYKEFCIHDEKGNFVANFAQTHGMSHLDVLRHLASYTPQVIQSVYKTFGDKEDLLRSVQIFVNGWVTLCTAHRRYHLVELFEDEGYLPPYGEDS